MKVHCPSPYHKDHNPSAHVYDNGIYCFSCGRFFPAEELKDDLKKEVNKKEAKKPEDLGEKYKYIDSLPKKEIRGLYVPYDIRGFYITYPNKDYYKYRLFDNTSSNTRYLGPVGHTQPMLLLSATRPSRDLLLIEGEINALSVAACKPGFDIACPGSATNFTKSLDKIKELVTKYVNVVLWVDADLPGYEAVLDVGYVLKLQDKALRYTFSDNTSGAKKDANWVLENEGVKALIGRVNKGFK